MAVDLGKIRYVNKGKWSSIVTYEIMDVVSHNGSTWASLANSNTKNTPVEGKFWTLMAKSTYQGWLDQGNSGTEQQFIESLKPVQANWSQTNSAANDFIKNKPQVLPDAPKDSKYYGRKDGTWVEIEQDGGVMDGYVSMEVCRLLLKITKDSPTTISEQDYNLLVAATPVINQQYNVNIVGNAWGDFLMVNGVLIRSSNNIKFTGGCLNGGTMELTIETNRSCSINIHAIAFYAPQNDQIDLQCLNIKDNSESSYAAITFKADGDGTKVLTNNGKYVNYQIQNRPKFVFKEPLAETDVWDGTSVSTRLNGSGVQYDPYQINSCADFMYFRQNPAKLSRTNFYKNKEVKFDLETFVIINKNLDFANFPLTELPEETTSSSTYIALELNGNGATISNFKCTSIKAVFLNTVFSYIHNINLKNFTLDIDCTNISSNSLTFSLLSASDSGVGFYNLTNNIYIQGKYIFKGNISKTFDFAHQIITQNLNSGQYFFFLRAINEHCKEGGNVIVDTTVEDHTTKTNGAKLYCYDVITGNMEYDNSTAIPININGYVLSSDNVTGIDNSGNPTDIPGTTTYKWTLVTSNKIDINLYFDKNKCKSIFHSTDARGYVKCGIPKTLEELKSLEFFEKLNYEAPLFAKNASGTPTILAVDWDKTIDNGLVNNAQLNILSDTSYHRYLSALYQNIKHTSEYNIPVVFPVSENYPECHDLASSIKLIPSESQEPGIKCTFENESGEVETWEYRGTNNFHDLSKWVLVGGSKINEMNKTINEMNKAINDIEANLRAWGSQFPICGMARINGDTDPAAKDLFSPKFIKDIGKHLRYFTVKNGEITHTSARGRLTLDENGKPMKIDGSEGDVMLGFDCPTYPLKCTKMVNGVETNFMGVALGPVIWEGVRTEEYPMFALTPWETVNCKIFDDKVQQAHCIYSKDVIGSHSVPTKFFNETLKPDGRGYFNNGVSAISAFQMAQSKNKDSKTITPYMGMYYGFVEVLLTMLYTECQTLDISQLNLFGTGCCIADGFNATQFNDDAISANSRVKIIRTDGTSSFHSFMEQFKPSSSSSATYLISGIAGGSLYCFVECGESVRVLDGIMAAGLRDKIGSKSNIFTYGSTGAIKCISDNSINLDTGAGMEVGRKYYIVRGVPKCEGLMDDVLTGVVNCYVKLTMANGVKNSGGSIDYSGATAIFKFSHGVYRGWCLPLDGVFRHMFGLHYTLFKKDGVFKNRIYLAKHLNDLKPLLNTTSYGTIGTKFGCLDGLTMIADNVSATSGYSLKVDYNTSLFCHGEHGGTLHTGECKYTWHDRCWGNGSNGQPAEGYESSQASACGCYAYNSHASVRTLGADHALSHGIGIYAGAFAVLLKP